MSSSVNVFLTLDKPAAFLKQSVLVSHSDQGVNIHIGSDSVENLRKIQKAVRHLDSQGYASVELAGAGWDIESQWAFYQGFNSTMSDNAVAWNETDQGVASQLDDMRAANQFTRELVNLSAEEIYPLSLAERVSEHLKSVGPEHVSARFIVGDELKNEGWMGI